MMGCMYVLILGKKRYARLHHHTTTLTLNNDDWVVFDTTLHEQVLRCTTRIDKLPSSWVAPHYTYGTIEPHTTTQKSIPWHLTT
ncbi:predicted protein [Lichtheimia corymbifera JMRC:FSU:9682]|uniref:Uncharacterized protein n=1 Tax=Lichtheimia corymbifera JMRC:FSU:9682 TaxID=1263082 RepID=A0A068S2H0_9FUNG|nr:predicted protein [Lichtheimia corymbifera JMRC:FSU:9682]